jgi:hypothetical protein
LARHEIVLGEAVAGPFGVRHAGVPSASNLEVSVLNSILIFPFSLGIDEIDLVEEDSFATLFLQKLISLDARNVE